MGFTRPPTSYVSGDKTPDSLVQGRTWDLPPIDYVEIYRYRSHVYKVGHAISLSTFYFFILFPHADTQGKLIHRCHLAFAA